MVVVLLMRMLVPNIDNFSFFVVATVRKVISFGETNQRTPFTRGCRSPFVVVCVPIAVRVFLKYLLARAYRILGVVLQTNSRVSYANAVFTYGNSFQQ